MKRNDLQNEAYNIGVNEARNKRTIVPACRSDEMMQFIGANSKSMGDSIPWLDAYNKGVATEINRQIKSEL